MVDNNKITYLEGVKFYCIEKSTNYKRLLEKGRELYDHMQKEREESNLKSDYPLKCIEQIVSDISNSYLDGKIDFDGCIRLIDYTRKNTYKEFYDSILPLGIDSIQYSSIHSIQ